MTGLVLLWCLAQAPTQPPAPVAVVVSSKRPGADPFSANAATRVHAALLREGMKAGDLLDDVATGKKVKAAGFSDARKCQGGASCLLKLALLLGPNAVVVGVDVGKIGSNIAIRLEAVSSHTGKSLLLTDVTAPVDGWGDKAAVPIALFARQLLEKLTTLLPPPPPTPVVIAPEPPPSDAPVVVALTPPPTPPMVEAKRSSRTPRFLKWTLGVGGVAAAGVSVGFLVAALNNRAKFNGGSTTTPPGEPATKLTLAEARTYANASNSQFTVSLVTAITSAVLLATATYLFLSE